MLKGSCGAEREGHPPSKRIRRAAPKSPGSAPSARTKGGRSPLNLGGTTKYPRYSRPSAFCWQGWEYFFAPDGAGFHFCFPTLETALGGVFRMHRRRDAIYSAVTGAPRARPRKLHILRSAASGRTHAFRCSSSPNCNRCTGLQFGSSPSCGKDMEEKAAGTILLRGRA